MDYCGTNDSVIPPVQCYDWSTNTEYLLWQVPWDVQWDSGLGKEDREEYKWVHQKHNTYLFWSFCNCDAYHWPFVW